MQQLFIKMTLDAWNKELSSAGNLFDSLSDEQLLKEIAPGKNTGIYLLGHLVAVHDGMLPLLGFGEKLFPELEDIFIKSPDKSGKQFPSVAELKACWGKVNEALAKGFSKTTAEEWFQKHSAVSSEDFAKEPHRNKLNLVINRTNHLAYHRGQVVLLKN